MSLKPGQRLGPRSLRRLKDSTLRSERQPRNQLQDARYATNPPIAHCWVFCASGATGISSATPGIGTGLLCSRDPSTRALSAISPNITITFDNGAGSFSGPAYCHLGWNTGAWSVEVVKCS